LRWAAFMSPRSKLDQMSRHGAFHQSDKKLLVGLWGIVALLSSVAALNQCRVSSGPN
jgi:hypothetical protein